jgi:hypothetical protein
MYVGREWVRIGQITITYLGILLTSLLNVLKIIINI